MEILGNTATNKKSNFKRKCKNKHIYTYYLRVEEKTYLHNKRVHKIPSKVNKMWHILANWISKIKGNSFKCPIRKTYKRQKSLVIPLFSKTECWKMRKKCPHSYGRKNIFPGELLFIGGMRKTFADEPLKVFYVLTSPAIII